MENASFETKIKMAMQLVIMDAMEKGHTSKEELESYMETLTFKKSVEGYLKLMK